MVIYKFNILDLVDLWERRFDSLGLVDKICK